MVRKIISCQCKKTKQNGLTIHALLRQKFVSDWFEGIDNFFLLNKRWLIHIVIRRIFEIVRDSWKWSMKNWLNSFKQSLLWLNTVFQWNLTRFKCSELLLAMQSEFSENLMFENFYLNNRQPIPNIFCFWNIKKL